MDQEAAVEDNGSRLGATAYRLGRGIREAMAAWDDAPASDEQYFRWLERSRWAVALGVSGRLYCYDFLRDHVMVL